MYDNDVRMISDHLFETKVYPQVCLKAPQIKGTLKNIYNLISIDREYFSIDGNNGADFAVINDRDKPMMLLGVRVQKNFDFRSFTITYWKRNGRASALDKLCESIKCGFYPKYTIQAFTKSENELDYDDQIDEIGIIESQELIQMIYDPECRPIRHLNAKRDGSEKFYYLNFEELPQHSKSFIHIKL